MFTIDEYTLAKSDVDEADELLKLAEGKLR